MPLVSRLTFAYPAVVENSMPTIRRTGDPAFSVTVTVALDVDVTLPMKTVDAMLPMTCPATSTDQVTLDDDSAVAWSALVCEMTSTTMRSLTVCGVSVNVVAVAEKAEPTAAKVMSAHLPVRLMR